MPCSTAIVVLIAAVHSVTASVRPPPDCFPCGTTPLSGEQIAAIDPEVVEEMRRYILENGPIFEGDDSNFGPMVELTAAQQLSFDFINSNFDEPIGSRKKRNANFAVDACQPVGGNNVVLLTIANNGFVADCSPNQWGAPSNCVPAPGGGCGGRCCLETICVQLRCVILNPPYHFEWIDVDVTRCTCCNT